MGEENKNDHKERAGDPSEMDREIDNDRVAGLAPDLRRPDTGVEQRNIDGSAMDDWQEDRDS